MGLASLTERLRGIFWQVKTVWLYVEVPETLCVTFRSCGLAESVVAQLLLHAGDLLARIAAWRQDSRGQQSNAHLHDAVTALDGLTCAM